LRFPKEAYNMATAAYRLKDISNMPDLKTNERLHGGKVACLYCPRAAG
jgi:hypothetical protein